MGWWPSGETSIIDRRRWLSAMPASGSTQTPPSSGPRCHTASAMHWAIASSSAVAARPDASTNPAIPHISGPPAWSPKVPVQQIPHKALGTSVGTVRPEVVQRPVPSNRASREDAGPGGRLVERGLHRVDCAVIRRVDRPEYHTNPVWRLPVPRYLVPFPPTDGRCGITCLKPRSLQELGGGICQH